MGGILHGTLVDREIAAPEGGISRTALLGISRRWYLT